MWTGGFHNQLVSCPCPAPSRSNSSPFSQMVPDELHPALRPVVRPLLDRSKQSSERKRRNRCVPAQVTADSKLPRGLLIPIPARESRPSKERHFFDDLSVTVYICRGPSTWQYHDPLTGPPYWNGFEGPRTTAKRFLSISKSIVSGGLRRTDATGHDEGPAGALQIQSVELSRTESYGD